MAENEEFKEGNEGKKEDDFVFIREEIKARPLNKKKLLKNTGLTALSAVVFGLIACLTFAVASSVINNKFGFMSSSTKEPATQTEPFIFPEETVEEEMNPEDMRVNDEPEEEIDYSKFSIMDEEEIKKFLASLTFSINDYQNLYKSLSVIADSAEASMVKVKAVSADKDWLDEMVEGTKEVSGCIIGENEEYLYVLTYGQDIKSADKIKVEFVNEISVDAEFIKADDETGLCAIGIPVYNINEATRNGIQVAKLGISYPSSVVGIPVIAVGCPMGSYGSIAYGMVTGNSTRIYVNDNGYKALSTDIYGSTKASGVIINLKGEVIGIISTKFYNADTRNLVSAIGISELKKTIEDLINGKDIAYLGVQGTDVPQEAVLSYVGAPIGAYVTKVENGSPAMRAGIQPGDIITKFNNIRITGFSLLSSCIRSVAPEETVPVTIKRLSQGEYREIQIEVQLGTK